MKPTLSLLLFAVLIPAQLFVPASMILEQETALQKGQEYKLLSRPVDPYDAFRGRYVRLSLDSAEVAVPASQQKTTNQKAYALLETDAEGFAHVKEVVFDKPAGTDYLKVRVGSSVGGKAIVIWPFERYYMEESKAPQADILYRSLDNDSEAYITVRVYKGTGVITGLYIDDIPIEEKIKN